MTPCFATFGHWCNWHLVLGHEHIRPKSRILSRAMLVEYVSENRHCFGASNTRLDADVRLAHYAMDDVSDYDRDKVHPGARFYEYTWREPGCHVLRLVFDPSL